jgi:prepilin-type N-terminal cleavage/methylation domain-containing protein
MKTLFKKSGFTLIELMIFIAVLAIIIVIGTGTHRYYQWLAKENNYSNAVRQMKLQKKILSSLPFDSLPPEIFLRIQMAELNLQYGYSPGSVTLFTTERRRRPL